MPIDRIRVIIRMCPLITDTQTNTLDWYFIILIESQIVSQMDGRTDGHYQVHYLPRFAVDNENDTVIDSPAILLYVNVPSDRL